MTELIKENHTEIVSFDSYKPKLTDANKLILKFLKDAYENKTIISKDDICELYIKWKFQNPNKIPHYKDNWGNYWSEYHKSHIRSNKRILTYITKEVWLNKWGNKTKCVQWFKNNLGAVILKGKLVVLPIIEI